MNADDPLRMLVELEEQLARAWVAGDRVFIEQLLAPEWTVIDPSGHILTRSAVIDGTFAASERRIDTMSIDDLRVQMLTDTSAVVSGRTRASGSHRGTPTSVSLRFTDVFVFRDGRWQVIASQGTFVS